MDSFDKRPQDPYYITDAQRDFLRREIFPYWEGKSLEEAFLKQVPENTARLLIDTGILDNDSKWRQAVGEITPDYQDVLFPRGYKRIKEEAEKHIMNLEPDSLENIEKINFYKSVSIAAEGIMTLAERYGRKAEEMADAEKDEVRKRELYEIARICRKVPANPPETFHEAQFVWFVQLGRNNLGEPTGS